MAETALPPLPEGFTLDDPANDNALPPLPEGFTLDAPVASAKLPALPEGFKLAQPEPGIVDKIGQPITDAKQAENMANAQGLGVLEGAKNLAKGIGERFVQLEGGAVRGMATALPGSDPVSDFIYWVTGQEKPANYPTPEEVTKTGQEVAKQMENVDLGFEEGDSWEDVKKAPASKFLPWAFKQGLLSAPDMALAMASLPGYAAIRSGELAQDRAENDQRADATVDDMLKTAPAAVVSGLLDRIGGRAMFGLDDVAVQGLKQVPKEVAKATVKEGVTEGLQEGVESVATTAGTEQGFDPKRTGEQMLAGALAGGVTGGTVRAGTGSLEAAVKTDTPVEGAQGETVETENPPLQAPVTQDGGEEVDSPLASSSSSVLPEERAILRRTSMPDEDIDAMSPEERAAKVAEARAAGIRVNGAMVRAAEQYQAPVNQPLPENVPIPAERPQMPVESVSPVGAPVAAELPVSAPVTQPEPELTPETQQQLADTVRQSVEADQTQQVEQAVQPVMPQLQQAVQQSVAADQDMQAEQAIAPVRPQIAQTVQQSVTEEANQELDPEIEDIKRASASLIDPINVAQMASENEESAYDAISNYRMSVKAIERRLKKKYGAKTMGDLDDAPLTLQERNFLFYDDLPDEADLMDIRDPVANLSEAVQQLDYALRKLPDQADYDRMTSTEKVNTARVMFLAGQIEKLGGDFKSVIKEAVGRYASRIADPIDQEFMARDMLARISRFVDVGSSPSSPELAALPAPAPAVKRKTVRTNEQGFPVDLKGRIKKPDSLIEFLARNGGVREEKGELSVLGLRDRKSGFVVGAGPLIRPKGMNPDRARETAAQAGYLPMESSLADFYDALDADARSGRQQFSQYDDDWSEAWREGQGTEERSADEERALSTEEEVRQQLSAYGFPADGSERFVSAIARAMDTGLPFEEAVESAYVELAQEARDLVPPETPDIPFFGDDLEVQPGTAPEGGEAVRATGEQVTRAEEGPIEGTGEDRPVRGEGGPETESDGSREDGGRSDREGESQRPQRVAEEAGADNKPQLVIPGAERAADADIAQRRADAPLKPKAPQKDPGGLFSDEMDQKDLLDFVVTPDQARGTDVDVDLPADPIFSEAVANTPGAKVTDDGLLIDLVRFQKEEQEGATSVRTGVFYLPAGSANVKHYRGGKNGYGGRVEVKGETLIRRPIFVKGATGGKAPEAAYDLINGKGAYDKMRTDMFRNVMKYDRRNLEADTYNFLEEYGADGNLAWDIVANSKEGNTLPYAIQENIVAHAVRDAGYDAVIGYSKAKTGRFISEVFDVREVDYPTRGETATLHPKFEGRRYSDAPSGWDMADAGEPMPKLSEAEQKRLIEIVSRTAGIDPSFEDTIKVPAGTKALAAWGNTDTESTAGGYYANMRDIIVLALDTAPVRAGKVAYHESFHRLQNLFLKDTERKLLKANDARLRKMIADKGEYSAKTVEAMSRKEVEAEAFGIWAAGENNSGLHIGIRKVWKSIRDMLTRVRNYLKGQGYQTVEDVFGKAKSGEIAKRPKQESKGTDKEYAIVDRAPDQPIKPKSAPAKPKNRFSDRLSAVSKALAAKAKSKGGKFDRLTEGDEETFGDLATRKVLDHLDPVLKMQEKVGVDLNDLSDAYLTARLAEGTIRHELHQVDEKYVQPAIKELAAVGATEKDLHEYLYAMHAPERNRVVGLRNEPDSDLYKAATDPSIRGASGMSTNEAKDMLRELAKDREKFMGIRRAASHIRAMLDDGLKRQLRAGLINKATYDELTQQWQHYVPLRAESDTDGTGGGMPSKSRGFDVRGDEFKGATGRYTKADNVVNYAVNNAEQSIIRAEKNKAATAALRFINQFDPQGESIAKVYWSEDPEKLGDITKAPPVYKRVIGKDGKVTNRAVNAFQMKDDVLAAKVGGKTYYMQFADPKVGLALKKMTFGELGATMRMLKTVSNWQSLINTRANPAFIPINFLRDVQTGATIAMSKDFKASEIAKMVGSIPSAWGALWRDARGKPGSGKWDKIVADFKANGGKISFDQYNTVEETAKKIQKDLAKAGSRGIAGKTWRNFIDLIENLNDTIENGMRVAIYNGAIEQGKTPKRAAFLARDLTVDFQKKGEITPHMNALYTFFNASVQGNTNFAKALYKSRKVKIAMGALIMAGYAQHIINSAIAGDDDDGENAYKKMLRNEPWTLERNIVLFLPGSKEYIKIPLGFGMNAFWHLGAQAGAITAGDKGFLDGALDSTRVGFDAFNPLGSGGWVSMALPSVIDPIWELGTNQNFSGNPIYPQENQYDPAPPPKSEQSFKSTSPVARWGAETLNKISGGSDKIPGAIDVYPDSLEYLWGWFTGGVGRFASQTVETAQRGVDLDFEPKKTPFIRSFYGSVDEQGRRSEYFAQRERVEYVKGKVKEFKEAGDEEGLKGFIADNQQDYDAIKAFEVAEKQRRRINKLRRKNEKREGAEKDLKALDEQELEVMNQARKSYFDAKPE